MACCSLCWNLSGVLDRFQVVDGNNVPGVFSAFQDPYCVLNAKNSVDWSTAPLIPVTAGQRFSMMTPKYSIESCNGGGWHARQFFAL